MEANWYADPFGRYDYRFHDGIAWTEYISTCGAQGTDPSIPSAAPSQPPEPSDRPMVGLGGQETRQVQDSERGRLVVSTGAPTPSGPQPPQGDPNTAAILQLVRVVVGIAGLALGIWGVGHAGGAW